MVLCWVSRWPLQYWHLAAFLPSCVVSGKADKAVQDGALSFSSNASLSLTDKTSQIRDTTTGLQAGRRHQLPQGFFSQFFPFSVHVPLRGSPILRFFCKQLLISVGFFQAPTGRVAWEPHSPICLSCCHIPGFPEQHGDHGTSGRGKSVTANEFLPGWLVSWADWAAKRTQSFGKQQKWWNKGGKKGCF